MGRQRCIVKEEKYVAAGMSVQHKMFDNGTLSGNGNDNLLRMDIKSSGWVIERNVKKPTDSIVSYITNINFGGSVPSALLKSIAKKQPLAIFYLGKALKQRAKELKSLRKQKRARQMQMQNRDVVMCDD